MDNGLLALLVAQGVLGGIDTLLNHERIERLRLRRESRREVGLHSLREAIYALLFGGLAWFEWHGVLALAIGALLLAELAVTAIDEAVENRTRVLPQNERILHIVLTLNLGAIIALLAPVLAGWARQPSALDPVSYGLTSLALSVLALFAAAWCVLDARAWWPPIRMSQMRKT